MVEQGVLYEVEATSLRVLREKTGIFVSSLIVDSTTVAGEVSMEYFKGWDREGLLVLMLDTQHKIINLHLAAIGTLNSCVIHPREIFKAAILSNASCFIIAHVHPSQNLTISNEDRESAKKLTEAGKLMGIALLDSIIVNDTSYVSLKEKGVL